MFFDGACSPNVNKERSGMNKQFDRRDTSLFFGLDKTVDRTEVVTNEVHDKNSVALDLKRILAGLEELKDRISTLEGTETTGLARNSLTYVDDVKFYNWLKSTYRDRISRRNFFSYEYIVGEPCWDIILDLCISEIEGRKISVTSACLASGVPITTALRWISLLERDRLIQKESDSKDRRRTFLRISKSGFESMFRYFKSISMRS